MSLNEYVNDLNNQKIKSHKDALKYFQVRYSSFNHNYPLDCSLPACTLAQYGFYFEEKNKLIKCCECDFIYADLNECSITSLLHKHSKFKRDCEQARASLEFILSDEMHLKHEEKLEPVDLLEIECEQMETDVDEALTVSTRKEKESNSYLTEESRFKSFENVKMLLNTRQLSEGGFYCVTKNAKAPGFDIQSASSLIEQVSFLVPALIHVKCAFCSYECLLFKNSLLNTMYKSPYEEHWQHSKHSKCQIFSASLSSTSTGNELEWLQALLDFETTSLEKKLGDIVLKQLETDDLIVKQVPKVIEQLIQLDKLNESSTKLSFNSPHDNVFYVPKQSGSASAIATSSTSDFNRLQNALNLSDNVISEKAYHPAYTLYETRFESFKEWPATLSQQPNDLAKAGFYYFGIKDMVKCFFCNGGLKNWDHNDDPYQDHVRWFPKCQFIRQLMGAEYVEHIKEKFRNQDSGFTNENRSGLSLNNRQTIDTSNKQNYGLNKQTNGLNSNNRRSISPRTLNSRMDTNILRKILDTNTVTRDSIKQAIEIKLSINFIKSRQNAGLGLAVPVYGDDFKSPIEMTKVSFELEKAKAEKNLLIRSISDLVVCFLNADVSKEDIATFILFQYNVYPSKIRILREENSFPEKRTFFFISLNKKDENLANEIVKNLNQNVFPLNKRCSKNEIGKSGLFAFRTNWTEFEDKIKPLLDKPIPVSNANLEPMSIEFNVMQTKSSIINNDEKSGLKNRKSIQSVDLSLDANTSMEDVLNDEKSIQLMEENERLKNERLCVICLTKDKNVLFLPCAHLAACLDCSFNLQNCAICRSKIQATVRTYN